MRDQLDAPARLLAMPSRPDVDQGQRERRRLDGRDALTCGDGVVGLPGLEPGTAPLRNGRFMTVAGHRPVAGRLVDTGAPTPHGARCAPFRFGLDRGQRGRHRLVPAARSLSTNASTTWGTGPRTSRKSTRSGRVNRTVSTVWATRPSRPPRGVKWAANTMSLPRSTTRSLSASARRARPRYGLGDDVEDHLAGGGHVDQLGAERPDPAA